MCKVGTFELVCLPFRKLLRIFSVISVNILLSTPILEIERNTEVNPLLTHNTSLTSYE